MLFSKKRGIVFAASAMLFVALGAAPALASCVGVVNAENVNLRSANSTSSEVLTRLSKGQSVKISSEKDGWYKVSADSKSGYVRADMLDLGASGSQLYAAKADINLRKKASTDSSVVKTLALGQTVSIEGISGEWYKVDVGGDAGFIRSDLLSSAKPKDAELVDQELSADSQTDALGDGVAMDTASSTGVFDVTDLDLLELGEESGESAPEEVVDVDSATKLSNQELQQALKDLGFYYGNVDGNFGSVSKSALMAFQRAYGLQVDGAAGKASYTAVSDALASGGNGSHAGKVQVTSNEVILAEWFNYMKYNFPKHQPLRCVDVETKEEYYLRAFACGNHADVETYTKEDTDTLYRINGNQWTWDCRPTWVYIDGKVYAAAINVKPHGSDTMPENGMNGQICMHFLHSRTHNTGNENKNMQEALMIAYERADEAPAPQASDYMVPPDLPEL